MGRKSYLAKNTLIFALGNFGTKMIGFFLVPIYTNILNTSEYGTVDLVATISTVLAPLIILNIGESLMRFPLDKESDDSAILSTGICLWVMSFFLTAFMLPIMRNIRLISDYSFYIACYTFALASSQLFLCYLRGKEKLLHYSIGNIINSLAIALLNILFLVGFRWGVKGYFSAYIIANLITALYACVAGNVISDLKLFHIDRNLSRQMIKYSIVLAPNTFLWWITNSSDRLMVTAIIGAAANGIYAISYKIPTLLSTIAQIFNQAWSYSAIRENESKDKNEYSNAVYNGLVGVTSIAASGMLLIIKPFLRIYVEKQFFDAWKYTPYLIIGFVFLSLGSFLATPYVVEKDSKGFLFSAMFGAVSNILMNMILIPLLGVSGAALATCLSYIGVFIYRIIDTRKYVQISVLNWRHLLSYGLLLVSGLSMFYENTSMIVLRAIIMTVVLYLFKELWTNAAYNGIKKIRKMRCKE